MPSPGVKPAAVFTCVVAPLEVMPLPVEPPVVLPPLVLDVAPPDVAVPSPLMPAPPVLFTLCCGVELLPPDAPASAVPPVVAVLPPEVVCACSGLAQAARPTMIAAERRCGVSCFIKKHHPARQEIHRGNP